MYLFALPVIPAASISNSGTTLKAHLHSTWILAFAYMEVFSVSRSGSYAKMTCREALNLRAQEAQEQ